MQSFSNFNRYAGSSFFEHTILHIGGSDEISVPKKLFDGLGMQIEDYSNCEYLMNKDLITTIWLFLNCQLQSVSKLYFRDISYLYNNFVKQAKPILEDYANYVDNVNKIIGIRLEELYKNDIIVAGLIAGDHAKFYETIGNNKLIEIKDAFEYVMDNYGIYTFEADIYQPGKGCNDKDDIFCVPICNSLGVKNLNAMYNTIADILNENTQNNMKSSEDIDMLCKLVKNDDFIDIFVKGNYNYKSRIVKVTGICNNDVVD